MLCPSWKLSRCCWYVTSFWKRCSNELTVNLPLGKMGPTNHYIFSSLLFTCRVRSNRCACSARPAVQTCSANLQCEKQQTCSARRNRPAVREAAGPAEREAADLQSEKQQTCRARSSRPAVQEATYLQCKKQQTCRARSSRPAVQEAADLQCNKQQTCSKPAEREVADLQCKKQQTCR